MRKRRKRLFRRVPRPIRAYVARRIRTSSEKKTYCQQLLTALPGIGSVSTAGYLTDLTNLITQGLDEPNRIGNEIMLQSITIKSRWLPEAPAVNFNQVRIMIVRSDYDLTSADMPPDFNTCAEYNRYFVKMDKM